MEFTVTLGHNIKDPNDFQFGGTIKQLLWWMNCEHNQFKIEDLRDATSKEEKQHFKLSLPYIVAGDFEPSIRNTKNFVKSNGLILDLDHVQNIDTVFERLKKEPLVHFAFRSPSGDGIKVGIKFSQYVTSAEEYKNVYKFCAQKFEEYFNIKTDKTCDCARACFLSFDEDYFFNENSATWKPVYKKTEPKQYVPKDFKSDEIDLEKIADICRRVTVSDYHDWVQCGMALATLGEDGRTMFKLLSLNKGYDNTEREIDFKFDSFSNGGATQIGSFFHITKQYGGW